MSQICPYLEQNMPRRDLLQWYMPHSHREFISHRRNLKLMQIVINIFEWKWIEFEFITKCIYKQHAIIVKNIEVWDVCHPLENFRKLFWLLPSNQKVCKWSQEPALSWESFTAVDHLTFLDRHFSWHLAEWLENSAQITCNIWTCGEISSQALLKTRWN
jgi:hypothetical protein